MTAPGLAGEVQAARAGVVVLPRLGPACTVRDGRFVEPCSGVADMLGLALVQVLDPRTRAPQSSSLMARTGGGLAPVRCCPACGVEVPV